jgi:hypothetical protein
MSLTPEMIERLPHVEGALTYIAPMAEKPYNLTYDPAPGEPRSNSRPDPHRVPIYDIRPVAARLDFDREGIALVGSPTDRPAAVRQARALDSRRRHTL